MTRRRRPPLFQRPASLVAAAGLVGSCITVIAFNASASPPGPAAATDIRALAYEALKSHPATSHYTRGQTFRMRAIQKEKNDDRRIRMDRYYKGLPVIGGDLILHMTGRGGFEGVSQTLTSAPDFVTRPALSVEDAWTRAFNHTPIHDVVAHYVGLIVIQSGALEIREPKESPAHESARLLGDLGRRAMGELRDLLDALRCEDDHGQTELSAGAQAVSTESWQRDIQALVNEVRSAGVLVTCHVSGEPQRAGAAAQRAAYRVIQEGIANAVRHAPGAEIRVAGDRVDPWRPPRPHRRTRAGVRAGRNRPGLCDAARWVHPPRPHTGRCDRRHQRAGHPAGRTGVRRSWSPWRVR